MAIKMLNFKEKKYLENSFNGEFEKMLRMCHEFDESIRIKINRGLYTSVDKQGRNVLIGFWYGDPDDFDDTVFVIFGENTDYTKRHDDGTYETYQGVAPSLYQEQYNELFCQSSRRRKPISYNEEK